jgi:hypothetical protein
MVNTGKRQALSVLIAAGGCVAGAYSAYAAFSNGKLITGDAAGTMFGLAFAAVVIISWMMLPFADKRAEEGSHRDAWLWRLSWFAALAFVLANSIVYTVHYRTEMTETKGLKIEIYERARQAEVRAAAEYETLRTNPRWSATSGCTDVTAPRSQLYCEQVHAAQARLQEASAVLAQGRPASKDAGAEILAWVLGTDEATVRRSLPVFWALILELIASLCMREAFATLRGPKEAHAGLREAPAGEWLGASDEAREAVRTKLPATRVLVPFSSQAVQIPRAAMNDNIPFAVYA